MIAVTILSIKDNKEKIEEVYRLNPDYLHVDVMDGNFVSNTVDFLDLPETDIKKDIHLMVYDVKNYVDKYLKYQPEYITFHVEATDRVEDMISYIKDKNCKVGISLNPDTSLDKIKPYLAMVDLVLVMSVVPGAGGQAFLKEVIPKLEELYYLREKDNYTYQIEVDGGVNDITKEYCKKADILVVGSYITKSENYQEKYQSMMNK